MQSKESSLKERLLALFPLPLPLSTQMQQTFQTVQRLYLQLGQGTQQEGEPVARQKAYLHDLIVSSKS